MSIEQAVAPRRTRWTSDSQWWRRLMMLAITEALCQQRPVTWLR